MQCRCSCSCCCYYYYSSCSYCCCSSTLMIKSSDRERFRSSPSSRADGVDFAVVLLPKRHHHLPSTSKSSLTTARRRNQPSRRRRTKRTPVKRIKTKRVFSPYSTRLEMNAPPRGRRGRTSSFSRFRRRPMRRLFARISSRHRSRLRRVWTRTVWRTGGEDRALLLLMMHSLLMMSWWCFD